MRKQAVEHHVCSAHTCKTQPKTLEGKIEDRRSKQKKGPDIFPAPSLNSNDLP